MIRWVSSHFLSSSITHFERDSINSLPLFARWHHYAAKAFYAPQLVPAGTAEARISYGISVRLSVRLSVTTRYGFNARWDRDSGSSSYDSLESRSFLWGNLVPLGEEIPLERGHQRGTPLPLRNRYFTAIGSSSVKTVANRHRLAAYHNKHCRRALQWYQHRWRWSTLNPQNRGL